jgi:apolipoprotein D and lipocalin family protein
VSGLSLRALLGLAAVAACAQPEVPTAGFRDPAVPIYSNAVHAPAGLAGEWRQVAAFAGPGASGCDAGRLRLVNGPGGLSQTAELCLSGEVLRASGALAISGPGRVRPAQADGVLAQEWWVLWVDSGYRTVVVGTPSGAFGFVLNRDVSLPPDRLQAAREVLDFNGYDLSRLVMLGG